MRRFMVRNFGAKLIHLRAVEMDEVNFGHLKYFSYSRSCIRKRECCILCSSSLHQPCKAFFLFSFFFP